MIRTYPIPPLFKAHCCQCSNELVGGQLAFVATLDKSMMAEGFEGVCQITCAECVEKMLKPEGKE